MISIHLTNGLDRKPTAGLQHNSPTPIPAGSIPDSWHPQGDYSWPCPWALSVVEYTG